MDSGGMTKDRRDKSCCKHNHQPLMKNSFPSLIVKRVKSTTKGNGTHARLLLSALSILLL